MLRSTITIPGTERRPGQVRSFVALQVPIVCIHTEEGRITLQGRRLRVFSDALVDEKQLQSDAEVDETLAKYFGISF